MVLQSKELLSAVLGVDIIYFQIRENEIIYTYGNSDDSINIYELMHKMKKYADEQGYIILSRVDGFCTCDQVDYISGTEFEAVTKACEWVLEQQK